MRHIPGFPLQVEGNKTFTTKSAQWKGPAAENYPMANISALGQKLEIKLLEERKQHPESYEGLALTVHETAMSADIQPYLKTVHDVRLVDRLLEIEFSAVGYEGRYVIYLSLDRPAGRYQLRQVPAPVKVVSSRSQWLRSSEGSTCVGEALDEHGNVLVRVLIQLEQLEGDGLSRYAGDEPLAEVDEYAMRLARELAYRKTSGEH